ncbi:helix-turn-helix transcriptional regulator [Conexibacter woesei]|uniref:Transcriptional regulator, XRE family n=1 Tax=Conexibacter woesei (strain DSM 14684 / CCUG 47730 / CIP 108061 / JCM 11494 / NBRC 100937 / ID131577) TaxID=469383 RepID=D3FEQ2_CONWI|nr:helix-turn-helix transcriptional regulator [Conexibacter woesei]ADB49726.1 transcriptional regulator, XRE family [Conexibacter woesei DSM 14684]
MGAMLRQLRTRAGITQRELAARDGLHRNYLGALERGTVANPGLATATRLARALDVSVSVLAESFVRPAPAGRTAVRRGGVPAAERVPGASEPGAPALGRALRLLRRRRELTRAALADATGMHKNYIGSLEEGAIASPGLLTLTRLVHGLHGSAARDTDALAASVGVLACVFAGEPVLVRVAA